MAVVPMVSSSPPPFDEDEDDLDEDADRNGASDRGPDELDQEMGLTDGEDEVQGGFDDSYDVTGLSSKLYSIPKSTILVTPKEIRQDREERASAIIENNITVTNGHAEDTPERVQDNASPSVRLDSNQETPTLNCDRDSQEELHNVADVHGEAIHAGDGVLPPSTEVDLVLAPERSEAEQNDEGQAALSANPEFFNNESNDVHSDQENGPQAEHSHENHSINVTANLSSSTQRDDDQSEASLDQPSAGDVCGLADPAEPEDSQASNHSNQHTEVDRVELSPEKEPQPEEQCLDREDFFPSNDSNEITFGDFAAAFPTSTAAESAPFSSEMHPDPVAYGNAVAREDGGLQWSDDEDDFGEFRETTAAAAAPSSLAAQESFVGQEAQFDKKKVEHLLQELLQRLPGTSSKLFPSPSGFSDVSADALDVTEDPLWSQVLEVEATPALNMMWAKAEANHRFLAALKIDARNVVFEGRKGRGLPAYAQGLTSSTPMLEPTKVQTGAASTDNNNVQDATTSIPPVQFDWQLSGLQNPLESDDWKSFCSLWDDLGLASTTRLEAGAESVAEAEDALFAGRNDLVEAVDRELQALGTPRSPSSLSTHNPTLLKASAASPTASVASLKLSSSPRSPLSLKAQAVIDSFPLLNFMQSGTLMFPVKKSEEDLAGGSNEKQ